MGEIDWGDIVSVLAVPAFTALVSAVKVLFDRSPQPSKRRYWEREFPKRIELARVNKDTVLAERLFARADIAQKNLDADEAIRRAKVPGAGWSWLAAFSAYIIAIGIYQKFVSGDWNAWSWSLIIPLMGVGVWAQFDAIQTPVRRQRLSQILVELMYQDGGYEDLIKSPELIVNLASSVNGKTRSEIAKDKGREKAKNVTSADIAEWVKVQYDGLLSPSNSGACKINSKRKK
ncbi:hypothetical protein [Brevibacterium linens]|uniref:hypothetical protein n=1 Tax=Brevibacterium linens TaxID=1703 RepID=UPI003BF481AD